MSTQAVLPAIKRLTKDYKYIVEHPSPNLRAHPTNDNIFFWYFVFIGPPDTPYANGQYFGNIRFPRNYPHSLPEVFIHTPNGRFKTSRSICLRFADTQYWSLNISVNAVLLGIVTFMCTTDVRTTGSVSTSSETRIKLAKDSKRTNCENIKRFKTEFPELYKRNMKELGNDIEPKKEIPLSVTDNNNSKANQTVTKDAQPKEKRGISRLFSKFSLRKKNNLQNLTIVNTAT